MNFNNSKQKENRVTFRLRPDPDIQTQRSSEAQRPLNPVSGWAKIDMNNHYAIFERYHTAWENCNAEFSRHEKHNIDHFNLAFYINK